MVTHLSSLEVQRERYPNYLSVGNNMHTYALHRNFIYTMLNYFATLCSVTTSFYFCIAEELIRRTCDNLKKMRLLSMNF